MEENQKKSGRGGARPGAGRPRKKAYIEVIQDNDKFENIDSFEKNIEYMLIPFRQDIENKNNQINLLTLERDHLLKENVELKTYSKIIKSNFFLKLCLKFFGLENFGK